MIRQAAASGSPVLTFRDLTLGYGRSAVLSGLDGVVRAGRGLALIGPNGAGKSTLLKGIVGEADILAGALDRHGLPVCDIAYLPQQGEVDRSFPISVFDFVSLGLWRRTGPWRGIGREGRARVDDALARLDLAGLAPRPIAALSGGQMQRALFGRLLLQDAPLILLDEPFSGIDEGSADDLLGLVAGWMDEGRTVLAALHDLEGVRAVFPDALLLAGRPVAFGPTEAVLTAANLTAFRGPGAAEARPAVVRTPLRASGRGRA